MEYVVVTYPVDRDVLVDQEVAGRTGDTLMVEAGHHVFDLGEPHDYSPESVEEVIENTTALSPLVIEAFHPAGTDA